MKYSATSGKNPKTGGRRYAILALITASVVAAILLNSCGSKEIPSNTPSASQELDIKPLPTVSSTPTEFVATKVAPTNTLEPTPTHETPKFTEAQLDEMAKEVKDSLPALVTKTIENPESFGNNPDRVANFFTTQNPESQRFLKLTQNVLNIIFSGRADLLKGINLQPFTLALPFEASKTESLPLTGIPNTVFTSEMNKQLQDAGLIVIFGGYALPDENTERLLTAKELFGVNDDFLRIYINGAPEVGPGGSETGIQGFNDDIGIMLGLDESKFKTMFESLPEYVWLTVLDVNGSENKIKIPVKSDGNLGVTSVTIISTNGARSWESIVYALTYNNYSGLNALMSNAFVDFNEE